MDFARTHSWDLVVENTRSISTISLPTDRSDRTGYRKLKKKKKKKEEEEKMGKANSAKETGRKGGHTHEKRKGSYTTSDRLTKKDELLAAKRKRSGSK